MGADMILEVTSFGPNTNEGKAQRTIIKALEKENFNTDEWKDYAETAYIDEDDELIKDAVIDIVTGFFDCLDSREVTWIHTIEGKYIITGGMSWGDDPTEAGTIMYKFNNLPQRILAPSGINQQSSTYDIFIQKNQKTLPKKLLADLKAWHTATLI